MVNPDFQFLSDNGALNWSDVKVERLAAGRVAMSLTDGSGRAELDVSAIFINGTAIFDANRFLVNSGLGGLFDANNQDITNVGLLTFGSSGAVTISRGAANRLDLAAGDSFRVVDGNLELGVDLVLFRGAANRFQFASGNNLLVPNGDIVFDTAGKGIVLKVGTNYHRLTISALGALVTTDLGTTLPV